MAEYNPSKIIKDGNTYNFRDTTKIPLAGSNEISGSLIPSTDGTVNLGSPSYQWNNAYIKSLTINGVVAGDILTHNVSEFVDVSSDQTIGGSKEFTDLQTIGYGTRYKGNKNAYILPEFSAGYSGLSITTLSFSQTLKIGNFVLGNNNKPVLDTSKAYIQVATGEVNNVNTCLIEPRNSTSSSLGTSTNKWKSFNGINPGALSLPSTSLINVASSITALDGVTINKFTPQVSGWLLINGTGAANDGFIYVVQGRIGTMSANNASMLRCAALIPVVAGVEVSITCKLNALTWANIAPCQGNV